MIPKLTNQVKKVHNALGKMFFFIFLLYVVPIFLCLFPLHSLGYSLNLERKLLSSHGSKNKLLADNLRSKEMLHQSNYDSSPLAAPKLFSKLSPEEENIEENFKLKAHPINEKQLSSLKSSQALFCFQQLVLSPSTYDSLTSVTKFSSDSFTSITKKSLFFLFAILVASSFPFISIPGPALEQLTSRLDSINNNIIEFDKKCNKNTRYPSSNIVNAKEIDDMKALTLEGRGSLSIYSDVDRGLRKDGVKDNNERNKNTPRNSLKDRNIASRNAMTNPQLTEESIEGNQNYQDQESLMQSRKQKLQLLTKRNQEGDMVRSVELGFRNNNKIVSQKSKEKNFWSSLTSIMTFPSVLSTSLFTDSLPNTFAVEKENGIIQKKRGELSGSRSNTNLSVIKQVREQGKINYNCLISKCGKQLRKAALSNPKATHELGCLLNCGSSDVFCQMKCGEMYKEEFFQDFHICALTSHQCIPQRKETPTFLPSNEQLVQKFSMKEYEGDWYITNGISKLFDCFPCQQHQIKTMTVSKTKPLISDKNMISKSLYDGSPLSIQNDNGISSDNRKTANDEKPYLSNKIPYLINYNIEPSSQGNLKDLTTSKSDGKEEEEETEELLVVDISYMVPNSFPLQTFKRSLEMKFYFKDPKKSPGILEAVDDSYLHQKDTWYIMAADPKDYMIVYYTGCNVAWCGYNGGVVYSRSPTLSAKAIDELETLSKGVGNDLFSLNKMCKTETSSTICSRP